MSYLQSYSQKISTDLPNVMPPSPTATQIAKYSLIGPSLSTGAAHMSIPLYTYGTKNLQVPVSLTYSSTGLVVNQIASRVGLGWMLEGGGSISRTVYGREDESGGRAVTPADFPGTTGDPLKSYITSVVTSLYDTQPDLYSFSFGGYSGRFTLFDGVVKKLEQNNLIITGDPTKGFTVITPDGIKYDFKAIESSSNGRHATAVNNAWHVTKITHPEGDIIYFKYSDCQFTYISSINQTFTHLDGEQHVDGGNTFPCDDSHQYVVTPNQIVNNGMYLTEISSNSRKAGILKLSYTPREDLPGDYRLSLISLYDGIGSGGNVVANTYFGNTAIKFTEFAYNTVSSSTTGYDQTASVNKRMFLASVTDDDKYYSFAYNNLDMLPPRLSYSQDDYGYYNGRANRSLVPQPNDQTLINAFTSYGYGDRRPDGNFSKIGMLSRVNYPTGGYDSLAYEANKVYISAPPNCDVPDSTFSISVNGYSKDRVPPSINYSKGFKVTCQQTVVVNVGCVPQTLAGDGRPGYPAGDYLTTVDLIDNTTNKPINWTDITGRSLQAVVGQSVDFNVVLKPGTYTVKVLVQGDSRGYANFSFNTSYAKNGNKEVAGVRIKRILSYNQANDHYDIRKFTYDTLSNSRSSGVLMNSAPLYQYSYTSYRSIGGTGTFCNYKQCYYTKLSSANYFESNATGNNIFYKNVTESLGDNFEGGGTEHTFYVGNADPKSQGVLQGNPIPGAPLSNLGMYSGKELGQRTFKKQGTQFITLKNVITTYKEDSRLSDSTFYYTLQANPSWESTCFTMFNNLNEYFWLNVSYYKLATRWLYPSAIQTIVYDSNGQNPVSSTELYFYDNISHQLLSRTKTINSRGDTISKQNFYPMDVIPGFASNAQAAQTELVNRNIISPLLYQKTSKNSTVLNTLRANYLIWPNNLVLPQTIETQDGTNLAEKRISFNNYDIKGNILEQQKINGAKQSFIWDYTNAFVVAAATNAGYNEIAYTSFEADSTGNWSVPSVARDSTTSITGRNSYALSGGAINKGGLTSTNTYVLSYWLKSSTPLTIVGTLTGYPKTGRSYNGWTYYEHRISGVTSVSVQGTSLIDELRLYPLKAQMTTYSYLPLTGESAVNDPQNKITYYDYDALNRLKNIRDQNGNIIKRTDYNFAGYSVNYGGKLIYHNDAQTGTYTRNNCGDGNLGTSLSFTIPAGSFSSTISQADADSQAIAALGTQGQANANANGTCIICTGESNRIINGVCEEGDRVNVKSVGRGSSYTCTYYYVFSDGSVTANYTEQNTTPCQLGKLQ